MTRSSFICSFVILGGFLFTGVSPAFSFNLPTVDCSNQSSQSCKCSDYPSDVTECNEYELSETVDITDGSAVNDAYAIETTYDSQSDTYIVDAQTTVPVTQILPVHPNDGEWTNDEVTNYLNEVLGLSSSDSTPPQLEDYYDVDKCDLGLTPIPSIKTTFSGTYARYDKSANQFTSAKPANFINDLLAGPDGEIEINLDGYDDPGLFLPPTTQCTEELNQKLEVNQCSYIRETVKREHGPCKQDLDKWRQNITTIGTRTYFLEYYENATPFEIFLGTAASVSVSGDISIRNHYYDSTGSKHAQDQDGDTDVNGFHLDRSEDTFQGKTSGVCGFSRTTSYIENKFRRVRATTAEGENAPTNCPSNPL